jgi:hypothetical protein
MAKLDPTTGHPLYSVRKDGNMGGVEDSNGNQIGAGNPPVDTLGRQMYGISYVDTTGTLRSPSVTTTPVTIAPTRMCGFSEADQCAEDTGSGTVNLPNQITLPNGMTYTLGYEQNQRGEINSITLPTGGTITYTYSGSWAVGGRPITTRTVSANGVTGTWTYNGAIVTDPYGNDIVGDCGPGTDGSYPYIQPCYPKNTKYYSGSYISGTLLKTALTDYTAYTLGHTSNNIQVPTRVTTTWNQTNQVTKTEMDRDTAAVTGGTTTWNNVLEERDYDWGNSGLPGPLIRKTHFNYLHLQNSSYKNVNIADRPTSKIAYDAVGNIIAQTTYTYDGSAVTDTSGAPGHDYTNYSSGNNIRGNITKTSRWLNQTNTWLNTVRTYNDLGDLLSTTDPNSTITSFDYTDNFTDGVNHSTQAYVTKTTYPLTNGVSHIDRKQY